MITYFDSSALVKRYVRESGSTTVRRLIASGVAASSRLSEAEVASGIIRRTREGAFTVERRDRMLVALQRDVPTFAIVELTSEVVSHARTLLLRHALRAGDAIQLASCLHLQQLLGQPVPLVVFDSRLARAGVAEGLTVIPAPGGRRTEPATLTATVTRGSDEDTKGAGERLSRVASRPRPRSRRQSRPSGETK